jgi:uncharacterized membrane protein YbhN (UPF0104 family)
MGEIERAATGLEGSAHHARLRALRAGERWLVKDGLRLLGYLIVAYLVIKLIPSLRAALADLERLSWPWLAAVLALETLSEIGFVVSWHVIVDPEGTVGQRAGARRIDTRLAWAQLGAGMFVPGGSLSSVGAGTWLLHRLGMPVKLVAERQFSLSFLNTTVDAIALVVFGIGLATGILAGESNLLLTLLPAAIAAAGVAATLFTAASARPGAGKGPPVHKRVAAVVTTLSDAVEDTARLLTHKSGIRSVLGAVAYLYFDVLVLFTALIAIHANPTPTFGVVLMAYIIGALGGSIPLPANIGTVAGMVGMLLLYGVERDTAVAAVVLYQAVGLLVPLAGGGIAYLLLRRDLRGARDPQPAAPPPV